VVLIGKSINMVKITISLPEPVLKAIEKERKVRGESRSEFLRISVEQFLKQEQVSKSVEAYIKGYRAMPESTGEIKDANQGGIASLAGEPWK
jgi:metal-responsive CopG/Arc/MetJ family transcriptional regulator